MIIGGKISPHANIVRTAVTCFSSQPDVFAVTNLEPLLQNFVGYHIEENWRFIHVTDEY